MRVDRRGFLQASALTTAGLSFARPALRVFEARAAEPTTEMEEIPTFCELCFWNCGLVAKVRNGKAIKLEGNPLSDRGRGRLCARGNGGLGLLYDPDRLKYPMINQGKRGDPKWRRASWDEVLDIIAKKWQATKQKYGVAANVMFNHGTGASFWIHLKKACGCPTQAEPSFQNCRGPRDVGFVLTYGMDAGSPEYYDFENSKYIVLFGHHLGENAHNSQVQDIVLGLSNGAKLTVVDPRFSTIASKANRWLPIKPATDMALLLAWIKLILDEELYDKPYVESFCVGLDELKQSVQEYTPEWASKETEIPKETIVEIARELASSRPNVCVSAGRNAAWYGDDVQRSRAIAILNALLGSWGRPGGYYLPAAGKVPKYPDLPDYPESERPTMFYPFEFLEGTMSLRTVTLKQEPFPIKTWIAYGTNLLKTMPNAKETIKAIKKLDLFVVVDVLPNDTMAYADIVLPECTYLERYDDLKLSKMKRFEVALRVPAVEPMFESKPSWWMTKEIAKRLPLGAYFPWEDIEDYLRGRCDAAGIDFNELKRVGIVHPESDHDPYIHLEDLPSLRTPSGKIELASSMMADKGLDAIPRYTRHPQPPEGTFRLLCGRNPIHSFSRTVNNFVLHDLVKENELWINFKKAEELGLKDGEEVRLQNQDGVISSTKVRVKATQRIRKDCVFLVHGFGVLCKDQTRAYEKGVDDNELMTRYAIDPAAGSAGNRVNFVKILKEA